ncbi:MAG: GntR family transcriptional regulator [Rhodospirillaceae bacterium]|nr:GntR family transcriptional regulator [Rhodospirillaceae bacterium]
MEYRDSLAVDRTKWEYQAPDTQKEIAYHRLEEKIVLLEFSPGVVVTEKDLAESIGLGRTPVREAIQQLAMAGLLTVLPRRGIKVSDLDACSVLRLLEVNRGLDALVARTAAMRATAEQRLEFSRLAEEFDDIADRNDVAGQIRVDGEFNNLCMLAMGNEHANKMRRLLQPMLRRFWFAHIKKAGDTRMPSKMHGQAARAVAEGNEDKAVDAFTRIIDYDRSFVHSVIYK